jgi:hypothetical protein
MAAVDYATPVGFVGTGWGRERSCIKNVARFTGTLAWQHGHLGLIELPAAPSRNDSGAEQCGHGAKCAYPILITPFLPVALDMVIAYASYRPDSLERGGSFDIRDRGAPWFQDVSLRLAPSDRSRPAR